MGRGKGRDYSYYSRGSASSDDYSYGEYSDEYSDYSDGEYSDDGSGGYRRSERRSKFNSRRPSVSQAGRKSKAAVGNVENSSRSTQLLIVGGLIVGIVCLFLYMASRRWSNDPKRLSSSLTTQAPPPSTVTEYEKGLIRANLEILPEMWAHQDARNWFAEEMSEHSRPTPQNPAGQYVTFEKLNENGRQYFYQQVANKSRQRHDLLTDVQSAEQFNKHQYENYFNSRSKQWEKRSFLHPNRWIAYEHRWIKHLLYLMLAAGVIAVIVLFFIIAANNGWNWGSMNDGTFNTVTVPDGTVVAPGTVSGGTFTADSTWLTNNPNGLSGTVYQSAG